MRLPTFVTLNKFFHNDILYFERTIFSFIIFINTTNDIVLSCRFTQRNLLRIYPKGTRLDSSNYDPMIGWMHGAQMVAFNMQVGLSFFLTSIK